MEKILNEYNELINNLSNKYNMKRKIFNCLYLLFYMLCSPYKKGKIYELKFANGPLHKHILTSIGSLECDGENNALITFGKKITNINSNVFTYISFKKRMKTLFLTIKLGLKNSSKSIDLLFIYFIFLELLKVTNCKKLSVAGIYDVYTRMLSLHCKNLKIKIICYQHGLAPIAPLEHKVYFDEVFCIDDTEKNKFSENIVSNDNCIYNIMKYNTNVKFAIEKFDGFGIAIGDDGYDFYQDVLKVLCEKLKNFNQYEVFVLNKPNRKKRIKKFSKKNIHITKVKIINVDYLILPYSTLIYDYLSNDDFKGNIIVYHPNYDFKNFNSDRVFSCKNIDEIINYIR